MFKISETILHTSPSLKMSGTANVICLLLSLIVLVKSQISRTCLSVGTWPHTQSLSSRGSLAHLPVSILRLCDTRRSLVNCTLCYSGTFQEVNFSISCCLGIWSSYSIFFDTRMCDFNIVHCYVAMFEIMTIISL